MLAPNTEMVNVVLSDLPGWEGLSFSSPCWQEDIDLSSDDVKNNFPELKNSGWYIRNGSALLLIVDEDDETKGRVFVWNDNPIENLKKILSLPVNTF